MSTPPLGYATASYEIKELKEHLIRWRDNLTPELRKCPELKTYVDLANSWDSTSGGDV